MVLRATAMALEQQRELLADKFDHHAREEGKILASYRAFAEELGDSSAGHLLNHILTEEEMHHLLLFTMANWLRSRRTEKAERIFCRNMDRDKFLQVTRELQRHERETIDACRRLQSELAGTDGHLLVTMLEAMILDSKKHDLLLAALEKFTHA